MSEALVIGEGLKLVMAIVAAPDFLADANASTTSFVLPECEIPIATSPFLSEAAAIACRWASP